MDVRILAAELDGIDWQAKDPTPPARPAPDDNDGTADPDTGAETGEATPGKTVVELNKVVRPGALAEGTVRFASGASAVWVIDQFQRLGLDKVEGKPTESDIQDFQDELQKLFR